MNTEHTNQSRQAANAAFEQWWHRHGLEDPMDDEDRYYITASSWARRGYLAAMQAQPTAMMALAEEVRETCWQVGSGDATIRELDLAAIVDRYVAKPPAVAVPVALPFFAYDSETGFERFATEVEAKAAAQESIEAYREDAGEGWAEEVENICWGVVLGTTREVPLPDEYSGSNGLADSMKPVDYVMTDAAQPPAVPPAVPDGYALVPIKPVLQQVNDQFALTVLNWWWHRNNATPENTLRHELEEAGFIPEWFKSHWIYQQDRTPNFGVHSSDIAELIYRAMLAAAQKGGAA